MLKFQPQSVSDNRNNSRSMENLDKSPAPVVITNHKPPSDERRKSEEKRKAKENRKSSSSAQAHQPVTAKEVRGAVDPRLTRPLPEGPSPIAVAVKSDTTATGPTASARLVPKIA